MLYISIYDIQTHIYYCEVIIYYYTFIIFEKKVQNLVIRNDKITRTPMNKYINWYINTN
jgi:hypothetical protein